MKQKIFIFLLTVIFIFSQVSVAEARGSRSRSFGGSKSFSRSFGGYSGSSHSKSSGGLFSKSSGKTTKKFGGYSGSSSKSSASNSGSSRSLPGSYSSDSASKSKSSFFSKSNTRSNSKKTSYMQDTYKKQASNSNFKAYKQNLNSDQKKAYDSAMNSNYRVKNRMNFEDAMRTRAQRASWFNSRPVFINVNTGYFGGPLSYGSAFAGPWDLWFLMRASDLFWYHHWHDIYPYRDYFAASEFARLEARVKELEKENNGVRDASYLDPNVDPDLQFSSEYQQKHLDNIYYTNKYAKTSANPVVVIVVIVIIALVLIVIVKHVSRPKPKKTFHSRIY